EAAGLDRLQPGRARERDREDDAEEDEQDPEPAVGELRARTPAAHRYRGRSTIEVADGSAGTRPWAPPMIPVVRFVPASFAWSAAMSAFNCPRWRLAPSRSRLSWSTATLTATTPASSAATTTIQMTPPARRR